MSTVSFDATEVPLPKEAPRIGWDFGRKEFFAEVNGHEVVRLNAKLSKRLLEEIERGESI